MFNPHYLPLAKFLSDIPWTTAGLHTARATVPPGSSAESPQAEPDPDVVVIGMAGQDRAHLWLFHTQASWQQTVVQGIPPMTVRGRHLKVFGLEDATCRVQWWHTREGRIVEESRQPSVGGFLEVPVPAFDRDLACRITEADALEALALPGGGNERVAAVLTQDLGDPDPGVVAAVRENGTAPVSSDAPRWSGNRGLGVRPASR